MDLPSDDWTAYINRRTGELVTATDEDESAIEDETSDDDLPKWQAEHLLRVREALASEDFLPLPSKFDINEYSIMERFCRQVTNAKARASLLQAIQGSGAFRRFRALAQKCGLIDEWHAFRDSALEEFAADWLDVNGIGYKRESTAKDNDT
jgi:hypothetical protein